MGYNGRSSMFIDARSALIGRTIGRDKGSWHICSLCSLVSFLELKRDVLQNFMG